MLSPFKQFHCREPYLNFLRRAFTFANLMWFVFIFHSISLVFFLSLSLPFDTKAFSHILVAVTIRYVYIGTDTWYCNHFVVWSFNTLLFLKCVSSWARSFHPLIRRFQSLWLGRAIHHSIAGLHYSGNWMWLQQKSSVWRWNVVSNPYFEEWHWSRKFHWNNSSWVNEAKNGNE